MGSALHTKGAGTAGVTGPDEARLDDGGLLAVGSGGLISTRTGVLYGPGSTALVAGTSSTAPMQYSVAAHHWVTNRGVVSDGVYRGAAETAKLVSTTAAPATGSRIDVVYVKQNDAGSTISPDATSAPVYDCVQGAPSSGTPTVPTIPVGAEELARVTVAAGATRTDGAGVTIIQTARQTVARGARVPVRNASEQAALIAFVGLEVYRLDNGQVQLCTAVSAGVGTFVTTYDPTSGVPRGRISSLLATGNGPSGISTTENMFDAITFTAVAGRRYRLTWDGTWLVSDAQVTAAFTVRTAPGASISAAGALHYSRTVRAWAFGEFLDKQITTQLSSLADGQTTVGIGVKVAVGSGTIAIPGDLTNQRRLILEDIGV